MLLTCLGRRELPWEGLRVQVDVTVARRNDHLFRLLCAKLFNGFFCGF